MIDQVDHREVLGELGLTAATRALEAYVELLRGPGVVQGVIGPREGPRVWERHVLPSLLLASFIEPGQTVVDVGTGAGLPGIPLALARPDLRVTLVEPLARRCRFLSEAAATVSLTNTSVVQGRAPGGVAGTFDVVTARAVAALEVLIGWCLPLMGPNGRLLSVRGDTAQDEVALLPASLLAAVQVQPARRVVAGGGLVHTTVVIASARTERTRHERSGR